MTTAPPSPSNIDAASPRGARQMLETTATRRTPSSQRLSAPSIVTPSHPAHRGRRDQPALSPTARTITITGKIHCHKGNHLPANCLPVRSAGSGLPEPPDWGGNVEGFYLMTRSELITVS